MYWIIIAIAIVVVVFLLLKRSLKISPLHKAIEEGQLDEAKEMIINGADVNTCSSLTGTTPLYSAAIRNQLEIVEMLLDKGASVSTTLRDGFTILHSIANGNTDCSVELLNLLNNNGLDINATDKSGQTAFFLSCFRKDSSLADYLLENGADVNICSNNGSPIHVASSFSSASLSLSKKHK